MEPRPVFADPSGRRHQVLRFAGLGSMAVLAAFLVAVVIAVTGGPQAPFTQWAVPQAPASSGKHGGDQALTGGSSEPGTPRASSGGRGSGPAGTGPAGPGGATTPGGPAGTSAPPASPSPSAGPKASPTASPAPTHGHSHGHGGPHSSLSPTATA